MKWTVLSDNRTNDSQLATEHGLSILLETERHRILLDTGASDVFIRNAERLNIDLSRVDYVFISHGHSDHAGGLMHLMKINDKAQIIVSPDAMSNKFFPSEGIFIASLRSGQRKIKRGSRWLIRPARFPMVFMLSLISHKNIQCPKGISICLYKTRMVTM